MEFERDAIFMEVMITIACFGFKEKYTAMQGGNEIKEIVENSYYLLAVFDAIMSTTTKANGKKVSWVDRIHFVAFDILTFSVSSSL